MKMPEISMQEALKSFSDMQDENSKILKDSNYKQILANTSLPWYIFFHDSKRQKSILANPVWIIFGETAKERNWKINLARVEISTEPELRQVFRAFTAPSFYVLENGFAYHYTGPAEPEDFEKLFEKKIYLQYDRKLVNLQGTISYPFAAKRYFIENPVFVMVSIFFSSLSVLYLLLYLIKKQKKRKVE